MITAQGLKELQTAVAELTEVASPRLEKAAAQLLHQHENLLLAQLDEDYSGTSEEQVDQAHVAFLAAAKAEFGIPPDSGGKAARTLNGI